MRGLDSVFQRTATNTLLLKLSSSSSSAVGWGRRRRRMVYTTTAAAMPVAKRSKKIVVIMGPTGCGKSKLSVDLTSRYFPYSEIINSDKIQVYRGLDITTNKIPLYDRKKVPHHLMGDFDSSDSHLEFTPSDFRDAASLSISQIHSRRKVPFLVGGSNSFIYASLAWKYNPWLDVFDESITAVNSVICKQLRYHCCFIWVDVSPPVLNEYLDKRVDDMLESGMFEELGAYLGHPGSGFRSQCGLNKAIGVPEFERYFKRFPKDWRIDDDDVEKSREYDDAVRAIKDNTCQLAKRQMGKILRLRDAAGWDLKRVDATAALSAAMCGGSRAAEIWERQVLEPSVKIVNRFLME